MLEQGKSVRSKEKQRGIVMDWPQPQFPIPLHCLGGGERGDRSRVEPGKKSGE